MSDHAPEQALPGTGMTLPEPGALSGESGADTAEGGSLDTIRDILFGARSRDLEQRIGRLEDRQARDTADLRRELQEESTKLSDDIRRSSESLAAALDRAVEALRHDKADRTAVATLLSEVAMRLSSDATPPAGK
jgi:hypothetical protein